MSRTLNLLYNILTKKKLLSLVFMRQYFFAILNLNFSSTFMSNNPSWIMRRTQLSGQYKYINKTQYPLSYIQISYRRLPGPSICVKPFIQIEQNFNAVLYCSKKWKIFDFFGSWCGIKFCNFKQILFSLLCLTI